MINSDKIIPAIINENISVNGIPIFAKNTHVKIIVENYKKKRFLGRGGYIIIKKVIAEDINGQEHIFSLDKKIEGENRDWVIACTACGVFIILAPLALFGFVKGKSAIISEDLIFNAYLDNSFTFTY